MTAKTKIYLAAAAAVVLLFLISSIASRIEISRMESQIQETIQAFEPRWRI